jgi:hypothetical protein
MNDLIHNGIATLALVSVVVAIVAHASIPWGYWLASTVGAFVAVGLTKIIQTIYFGHLHPLWPLSIPGELAQRSSPAFSSAYSS